MRKTMFYTSGVLLLLMSLAYGTLYRLTPAWTGAICGNCELGIFGTMKYRAGYLRAQFPAEIETYEDKWFRFSHFKNMTVDIDEEDNHIDIFGYILPDGTYAKERSSQHGYSEISIGGSEEPTPAAMPELQKDASGYFRLPGLPNLFGKIIPQSFTQVKLRDGTVAVVFITKSKMSSANTIGPYNEINAYLIPSKNHLLDFSASLGCDPLYMKQKIAVFNQVLTTFEIKSQWKWKVKQPISDKKNRQEIVGDIIKQLRNSVERMKQREEVRRSAK